MLKVRCNPMLMVLTLPTSPQKVGYAPYELFSYDMKEVSAINVRKTARCTTWLIVLVQTCVMETHYFLGKNHFVELWSFCICNFIYKLAIVLGKLLSPQVTFSGAIGHWKVVIPLYCALALSVSGTLWSRLSLRPVTRRDKPPYNFFALPGKMCWT